MDTSNGIYDLMSRVVYWKKWKRENIKLTSECLSKSLKFTNRLFMNIKNIILSDN